MSELSKEEVFTLVEVMGKTAVSLEKITTSLETASETMKEINTRLHNGITKEIVEQVSKQCVDCRKLMEAVKDDTGCNKVNIANIKAFVGVIAIAIIIVTSVVTVITRVIDAREFSKKETKALVEEMVKEGMSITK